MKKSIITDDDWGKKIFAIFISFASKFLHNKHLLLPYYYTFDDDDYGEHFFSFYFIAIKYTKREYYSYIFSTYR